MLSLTSGFNGLPQGKAGRIVPNKIFLKNVPKALDNENKQV
jgi:hypothetical protein